MKSSDFAQEVFMEEPRGEAYRALIEEAMVLSAEFLLVVRDDMSLRPSGAAVLAMLEQMRLRTDTGRYWPGGEIKGGHLAKLHYFRCDPKASGVLCREAEGLYQWTQPKRPEDLSFIDSSGNAILVTTAHERLAWIAGSHTLRERFRAVVGTRYLPHPPGQHPQERR